MKWEQYYSHTYNDQGHIKHVLKTSPLPVIDQEGLHQITVTPTVLEENEHIQNQALHTSNQQRRVQWNDNPTIHTLKPCGATCQRPHYKKPDITICVCGRDKTPTTWEHNANSTAVRAARKLRHGKVDFKSKKYRDGLTDVAITMYKLGISKNSDSPNCPQPKNKNKWDICLCSICLDEVDQDKHTLHIVCPTTNNNQAALKSGTAILQRPKQKETSPLTNTPSSISPKTLQQRQEEYDLARKQIFDTCSANAPLQNKIYKHPNHALRAPKI